MSSSPETPSALPFRGWFALLLGCLVIGFGWIIPSRFNSVPFGVLREAGQAGPSVADLARARLADGDYSSAKLLAEVAGETGSQEAIVVTTRASMEMERNPQLARWGSWDPFLDAALKDVPLDRYAPQPGLLGILIAGPTREPVAALLENSRNPLLQDLLATGDFTTYQRLFPVSSASGRPLEATLLGLGLLAQGDHFTPGFRSELRELLWAANASGGVGALEDVYLDALSIMRLFDWGQTKELFGEIDSADDLRRLRYLLHRKSQQRASIFTMSLASGELSSFLDYLAEFGDEGLANLTAALATGVDGFRLPLREQLPVEMERSSAQLGPLGSLQDRLAPHSLRNPQLSIVAKYAAFFFGSFLALYGTGQFGRFYKERVSRPLAFTQRFFGATASVVVFAVLSEPYLSRAGDFEGYSYRFVMPVLAEVDGELQIVETTPTLSMEPATLLSIAFFFLLQALVFLICMLKVKEIEKRDLDPLLKLRLMENEENLFDSGLYVGIAGTCIALVMQVINVVEANLLAAYSSNLFGILCVAIVKIRLVRPYKTKLIMAGQSRLTELMIK